jgi:hypothetical protein
MIDGIRSFLSRGQHTMPLRILAIVLLTASVVTGFLLFGDAGFRDSVAMTGLFLISTVGFLTTLIRIMSLHMLQIGKSIPRDNRTHSN